MKNNLNYFFTAMMLFSFSFHVMGHQPHCLSSDLELRGEVKLIQETNDECEPGEAWCNNGEHMEIAYTHNGEETAVFYLKASNDSSRNKLSGYDFTCQLLDDYEPWDRSNME